MEDFLFKNSDSLCLLGLVYTIAFFSALFPSREWIFPRPCKRASRFLRRLFTQRVFLVEKRDEAKISWRGEIGNLWPYTRWVFLGEEKTPRKKRLCKRGLRLNKIDIEATKWGHYPELHSTDDFNLSAHSLNRFDVNFLALPWWRTAEEYFQPTWFTMLVMVDATHKRISLSVLCIEIALKRRTLSV